METTPYILYRYFKNFKWIDKDQTDPALEVYQFISIKYSLF